MKLFPPKNQSLEEDYLLLKKDIQQAAQDLRSTYINLSHVVEPDLIDYYIYKAKADQMRYTYLLHCAKKLNL